MDWKPGWKPTCKEVHRLISEGMDRRLSPVERFRMRLHLSICDVCTTFGRQMRLLRSAMRRLDADDAGDGPSNPPG